MGAFEQHYTVQEIAEKWHLSEKVGAQPLS
jgi:hypothetical protein